VPAQQKPNDVKECLTEGTKINPCKKFGYKIEHSEKVGYQISNYTFKILLNKIDN